MSSNRFLCLHLHFYQPPRENPWLNEIEYQESAYPFHDWNERINRECYRANGASRILDSEGRIVDLANNYSRVSFNFGPTLLSWMEDKDPVTYQRILEGDRLSQNFFGGHGSAIAQAYNHLIMPLANRRDKETQIVWGLRDFEKRFQRNAEAMWLPETAVDMETLEMMAYHGMKYAILAPRQAKAIRSMEHDQDWQDASGEKIDPREPYLVRLPSGRSIAAFFYNGPISKAVAFEGLLHNGEEFASRLLSGFENDRPSPQLMHIAADGETYGHHHRQGDMALAYALWHIQKNQLATITNYGQFLEMRPPRFEAQVQEFSSWSCEHGIDRWMADCGCNSGGSPGWSQKWRAPLRQALDQLRDQVEAPFENEMKKFMDDPWAVRNEYIEVVEDQSLSNVENFLKKVCRDKELSDTDKTKVLKAFEGQKHMQLMYTSCGWFFDEVSGVETVQNMQYAYRALELSESALDISLFDSFVQALEKAPSNIPALGNGRTAFERYVMPSRVDTQQVGIHFAIASLFEEFGEKNEVYNSKITLLDFKSLTSGKAKMVCGSARIRSRDTLKRHHIMFGVIHMGDHNVTAGVKDFDSAESYDAFVEEATSAFTRADFHEVIRIFDRHFGKSIYSLKDLFKDEKKRITEVIMSEAMAEAEGRFERLYKNNFPLVSYLANAHFPIPKVFGDIAEFVENRGLQKTLRASGRVDIHKVRSYLQEAKNWGIRLDVAGLSLDLGQVLEIKMREFEKDENNADRLEEILDLVKLDAELPLSLKSPLKASLNTGTVQNWFFSWYRNRQMRYTGVGAVAATADQLRVEHLVETLASLLKVKFPTQFSSEENHGQVSI